MPFEEKCRIDPHQRCIEMAIKLGVVMDPIESINPKKDSSLAMLLAAQKRDWELYYMEMDSLLVRDGEPHGHVRALNVADSLTDWFSFGKSTDIRLRDLDVILMRKDPPFDMEYVYATYLLERAEEVGVLVVNRPRSIRDANEKLFTAWFPQCCPPTQVSRRMSDFHAFLDEHQDIIVKPLDGMGGASIFRVSRTSSNTNVIFETLTGHGQRYAMAQRYVPEITAGDKRILLVDGEPLPYVLARVPHESDLRGNLAAGATGVGRELSERDRWIAQQVGPQVRERGLLFVGCDVIGDYLTEINVTSPTCIKELDGFYDLDIGGQLMEVIDKRLSQR